MKMLVKGLSSFLRLGGMFKVYETVQTTVKVPNNLETVQTSISCTPVNTIYNHGIHIKS